MKSMKSFFAKKKESAAELAAEAQNETELVSLNEKDAGSPQQSPRQDKRDSDNVEVVPVVAEEQQAVKKQKKEKVYQEPGAVLTAEQLAYEPKKSDVTSVRVKIEHLTVQIRGPQLPVFIVSQLCDEVQARYNNTLNMAHPVTVLSLTSEDGHVMDQDMQLGKFFKKNKNAVLVADTSVTVPSQPLNYPQPVKMAGEKETYVIPERPDEDSALEARQFDCCGEIYRDRHVCGPCSMRLISEEDLENKKYPKLIGKVLGKVNLNCPRCTLFTINDYVVMLWYLAGLYLVIASLFVSLLSFQRVQGYHALYVLGAFWLATVLGFVFVLVTTFLNDRHQEGVTIREDHIVRIREQLEHMAEQERGEQVVKEETHLLAEERYNIKTEI